MRWTLPNTLTTLRLLAAPGVAVMFLYFARPWADWLALVLFLGAAITDWFDGYIARRWKQETKLGAMLDPIADKAMVIIALMVIVGYSSMSPWLVLPATVILFREVFVSGLREFLGDVAGTLKVTKLAKWKTTLQMVAISMLFAQGVLEHYLGLEARALGIKSTDLALTTPTALVERFPWLTSAMELSAWSGIWLLWIAAALTLLTGWDYFQKALPHLKEAP